MSLSFADIKYVFGCKKNLLMLPFSCVIRVKGEIYGLYT